QLGNFRCPHSGNIHRPMTRPVVQLLEQFGDRRVELGDREEGSVPQPRQNPALDNQHRAFDLGLLSSLGLQFVLTLERV
ncbi:hypothetical protein, partial [Mesorhizobium sp.]|uniref:hypothetical protein n=1 Tax=Mesorhizobium sp. TaxID=1871066 RepID=UPI00257A43A5